ncbi:MAG: PD-(D/E)XK nuclease family protein [Alistipes sp.]|nr:PD-(D/E)XK nuclease family protein [Alistipes sp.]
MSEEFEMICKELQKCKQQIKPKSIPEVFGIQYKEVYITHWLGYLLDPNKNGLGIAPLNALLIAGRYERISENVNMKEIKVYTEYVFDNNRRIDIFIETPECLIGIENKIWSDEQIDQTKDYTESLDKIAADPDKVRCIYLYPEQNKNVHPVESFHLVTYGKLHDELKKIATEDVVSRDQWILNEFIKYVEEHLMIKNEYPSLNQIARIYADYLSVIQSAKSEYDNYVSGIESWIFENLESSFKTFKHGRGWWAIIQNEEWNEILFHFEVFWNGAECIALAKKMRVVIHLETSNKMKNEVLKFFEEHSGEDLEQYRKKSQYTLCSSKEFDCDFENEEAAKKSLNKICDIIKSNEFQKWAKIADDYCNQERH